MDKLRNAVIATVLSILAALGAVGCFATGMRQQYSGVLLVLGITLMAAVLCFALQTKFWPIPLVAAVVLFIWWWQEGTLRYSVEGLIYTTTNLYDQGYGWGVLQWSQWHMLLDDATPALLLMAFPIVAVVGITTVRGSFALLGAGVALVPLLLCLFLKDTVPDAGYLGLLLFALVAILLTQNVRSRSGMQADRLTVMAALPLALALLVLFLCIPQDTYNGQEGAQKIEDFVLALFEQSEAPDPLEQQEMTTGDQDKQVRLDRVGSRKESDKVIMTVKADTGGTLYLRGCAYDRYDGKNWTCTPGWNAWSLYYNSDSSMLKSVTIQTESVHSVLYFTYAPFDTQRKVVGGRIRNDENLTSYTMRYRDPIAYSENLDEKTDEVGGAQLAEYLQLPDSTRAVAEEMLRRRVGLPTETNNAGQTWRNAMYIAQWVSGRAKYSLDATRMPITEDDFALWFLEKADVGYCTHFATATVVLLRAAGIPAQYVTGYVTQVSAGKTTAVTQKNAHAWVEAFINGVGWVVLEPTPSAGGQVGGEGGDVPYVPPVTLPQIDTPDTQPAQTEEATQPGTTPGTEPGTEPGTQPGTTPDTQPDAPSATQSTGLSGLGGADAGEAGENAPVLQAIGWLVGIVLFAVAVVAQWRLRVAIRYGKLSGGQPNLCALYRWAVVERMSKLLSREPSEEIYWIAQKARFSQHTVTREELRALWDEITVLRAQLRRHSLPRRLLYTLILAIY